MEVLICNVCGGRLKFLSENNFRCENCDANEWQNIGKR